MSSFESTVAGDGDPHHIDLYDQIFVTLAALLFFILFGLLLVRMFRRNYFIVTTTVWQTDDWAEPGENDLATTFETFLV